MAATKQRTPKQKTGPRINYRAGIGNGPAPEIIERPPLAQVVQEITGKPFELPEQRKRALRG